MFRGFRYRSRRRAPAVVTALADRTTIDAASGAVRSIQTADLETTAERLDRIWTPHDLERLARTYWRFLSRATAFVISVRYSEHSRQVVAFGLVPLLTFQVPEYEMDAERGMIRWRIDRGVLVSRAGRGGSGYLEIVVRRQPARSDGFARADISVEVANFYPAIASRIGRRIYMATQSRIHVVVTHGFLRSLARLDLAESRVGRFPAPLREPAGAPRVPEAATWPPEAGPSSPA
ncbi:MAG TPA: hypothetical protein VFB41_03850 [Solirubrobacteraceae bacterium]|nr:hypothetical protein [Solirubrobacteraceae bacterium]